MIACTYETKNDSWSSQRYNIEGSIVSHGVQTRVWSKPVYLIRSPCNKFHCPCIKVVRVKSSVKGHTFRSFVLIYTNHERVKWKISKQWIIWNQIAFGEQFQHKHDDDEKTWIEPFVEKDRTQVFFTFTMWRVIK